MGTVWHARKLYLRQMDQCTEGWLGSQVEVFKFSWLKVSYSNLAFGAGKYTSHDGLVVIPWELQCCTI
jgi:hypothetical protein